MMNNKTKSHAIVMAFGLTNGKLSTDEINVVGTDTMLNDYFKEGDVFNLGDFMSKAQVLNVQCELDDVRLQCNLFELYVAYCSFSDIKRETEQQAK